jgi:hypothetical protein
MEDEDDGEWVKMVVGMGAVEVVGEEVGKRKQAKEEAGVAHRRDAKAQTRREITCLCCVSFGPANELFEQPRYLAQVS